MLSSHQCARDRVSIGKDYVVIIRLAGNDLGSNVESSSRRVEIGDPVLLNQRLAHCSARRCTGALIDCRIRRRTSI